ncbi:MAG: hypothetical protein PHN69_05720 [Candidatus Pacebacteria bacterium]|nr:hypothetical protein [Candidatus Paceibacterota bacterium]
MLTVSTVKSIGKNKYTFSGNGENLFECITELGKASFGDVPECGICGSDNLYLESHVAQNKYKYHSIKCAKCRSSLTFGKRENDDNISFLRRAADGSYDWKKFEPKE